MSKSSDADIVTLIIILAVVIPIVGLVLCAVLITIHEKCKDCPKYLDRCLANCLECCCTSIDSCLERICQRFLEARTAIATCIEHFHITITSRDHDNRTDVFENTEQITAPENREPLVISGVEQTVSPNSIEPTAPPEAATLYDPMSSPPEYGNYENYPTVERSGTTNKQDPPTYSQALEIIHGSTNRKSNEVSHLLCELFHHQSMGTNLIYHPFDFTYITLQKFSKVFPSF